MRIITKNANKGNFFIMNRKILNIEGAVLNIDELSSHLQKVASTHSAENKSSKETYPVPRLIENYEFIK